MILQIIEHGLAMFGAIVIVLIIAAALSRRKRPASKQPVRGHSTE